MQISIEETKDDITLDHGRVFSPSRHTSQTCAALVLDTFNCLPLRPPLFTLRELSCSLLGSMALGILVGFLRGGRAVPRKGISALTSKRGPRNFYKGKGCKSTGRHTSTGGYVLMEEKLPKYIVPDLTNCKMLPYVAHDTPKLEVAKDKVAS